MKVRLHEASLRLRLSTADVALLARGEPVEAITVFPGGGRIGCVLAPGSGSAVTSRFAGHRIEVDIPSASAVAWAAGNEITLESRTDVPGGSFRLLIEKDLPCSHDHPPLSVRHEEFP